VLKADGTIAQQGPYDRLKILPGFVRDTLTTVDDRKLECDVKEESTPDIIDIGLPTTSPDELLNLTRQVGDITVYKYYAESIGKFWIVCVLMAAAAFAFSHNFPRM